MRTSLFRLGCVAGALLLASAAGATPPAPPCPRPVEVTHTHLLGLWHAEFEGLWQGATVLLEQHPTYVESFSGGINRNGERGRVAGDIEDGEFTMEESADGKRIAATWIGQVVDGSCGREIRGTWQAEGEQRARHFSLKRAAGR